ncbi:uncharacterized protein PFL1_02414 [Pseudozyma flocculosa PF-1]|uniref:uncharacterized protein n=1 Tax=Pseudozyma flocculosa PF-1 TaxID=1277687 RepID=UPI000456146E|nr:uncharacterized protein PFL1_02414 [Pseudozyma flocculosa PF-1]EPQ30298.1 hypothetical protein PFL1_02414 [Pseudozyma flocculosa PF-1]
MEAVQRIIDGKIDFEGQRLAERIYSEMLIIISVVGLVMGFMMQNMLVTLSMFGLALVFSVLIVVPPWPFLNRYHMHWLPKRPKDGEETTSDPATQDTPPTTTAGVPADTKQ